MPDGGRLPGWPRAMRVELAAAYCGISRSSLHALADAGDAPKPVKLTAGIAVWLREDLDAWLDRRAGRAPASPQRNTWDACSGGNGAA